MSEEQGTYVTGNPLEFRREEILEAIANKTYQPGQYHQLIQELAEIDLGLNRGLAPTTNGSQPVAEQQEPSREGILPNKKPAVYSPAPDILKQTYLARTSTIPNNQQIVASPIIARATVRIPGADHVIIVAAFQLSHERAFWFVFKAKTARSPRKTWKQTRCLPARTTFPTVNIITLESIVRSITDKIQNAKITRRYAVGKRYLSDHLTFITHPTYARNDGGATYKTDLVNRRNGWKPSHKRPSLFGKAA